MTGACEFACPRHSAHQQVGREQVLATLKHSTSADSHPYPFIGIGIDKDAANQWTSICVGAKRKVQFWVERASQFLYQYEDERGQSIGFIF